MGKLNGLLAYKIKKTSYTIASLDTITIISQLAYVVSITSDITSAAGSGSAEYWVQGVSNDNTLLIAKHKANNYNEQYELYEYRLYRLFDYIQIYPRSGYNKNVTVTIQYVTL